MFVIDKKKKERKEEKKRRKEKRLRKRKGLRERERRATKGESEGTVTVDRRVS